MTSDELRSAIAGGESPILELKTSVPPPEIVSRHISAFANTSGGKVVFGVREPVEMVGINESRLRSVVQRAQEILSGSVSTRLEFVEVEGLTVGVLTVEKAPSIVAAHDVYYSRADDKISPITAEQIRAHLLNIQPPDSALTDLSRIVAEQTRTIERLREEFSGANSPWKKLGIAAIGAAVGAFLKAIIEHFWR
ncbi:MAG: ATP-binding protein [Pseudomonadota bacterium]